MATLCKRSARRSCDEVCIRRIAAHLCQLQGCSETVTGATVSKHDAAEAGPSAGRDPLRLPADETGTPDDDVSNKLSDANDTPCGNATCCGKSDALEKAVDCCTTSCKPNKSSSGACSPDHCCTTSTQAAESHETGQSCCEASRQAGLSCGFDNGAEQPPTIEGDQVGRSCCAQDDTTAALRSCGVSTGRCCTTTAEGCTDSSPACCGSFSEQEPCCGSTGCNNEASSVESKAIKNAVSDGVNDLNTSLAASCADDCCANPDESDTTPLCSAHLRSSFERYEALIRLGHCLCRRVLSDLGFCCCSPSTTSTGCSSHAPASRAEIIAATPMSKIHSECERHPTGGEIANSLAKQSRKSKSANNHEISHRRNVIEKTASREHVVVSVAGMTCTGCVKKINKVMAHIQGVSNATTTFVSEIAAFDVDTNVRIEDVILQIEKETGFKLSRKTIDSQYLDVVMDGAKAQQYHDRLQSGVLDFEVRKSYCRITYDPAVVGARSILRPSMQLAPPADDAGTQESRKKLHLIVYSFLASGLLTIPVLVLNWSERVLPRKDIVSCILATLVQGIAIPNFYVGAMRSLIHSRVIEMDMLVVISITAAYVYSIVAFGLSEAGIELETHAFFETSTLLITLVLLGRLLTAYARIRAIKAVATQSLQVDKAVLIADGTTEIDARLLHFGDVVRISPHCRVVTDGEVITGTTTIDESMITGESVPVLKRIGDTVIAGTLNGPGTIDIQVTRLPGESSITDIAKAVQDALATKPRVQDLADKLAGYFIPVVIALGVAVFLIWIAIAIAVRRLGSGAAVGVAITYSIAVFAVSCPCALGLAVPMVLVIAGAVSARQGVIIRAADVVQRGFRTTDVVFDKTGTLTLPGLDVVEAKFLAEAINEDQIKDLTRSMVQDSTHPVSVAIRGYLKDGKTMSLSGTQSIPGAGIEAYWAGSLLRAGNAAWTGVDRHADVKHIIDASLTCFCVTLDGQLLATFGLASVLRGEARYVVQKLQHRGIRCHIVSGDAPSAVRSVADQLDIATDHVRSQHSPADKQKYVKDLQTRGKVVFVGDGTNDAVAVAQADIGVQIGTASDVTDKVADVVLLGRLDGILTMLDVSKRAWWRICFNFAWAGVYNVLAILLAAGAFVNFRLSPTFAGLGEIVSVLPVILAAATLSMKDRGRHK